MDCTPIFKKVLKASRTLNLLDEETINKVLMDVAESAIRNTDQILFENVKDLNEWIKTIRNTIDCN